MSAKQRFLYFFIDGVGIGEDDPLQNPFVSNNLPFIQKFFSKNPFTAKDGFEQDNCSMVPVDACMKTAGLPQSATGQTALFTGINPCLTTGRHMPAFPTGVLKEMLEEHSILKVLKSQGYQVTSANTYSKRYFDKVGKVRWLKYSATTLAILAAEIPFRMLDDAKSGRSVYHDLTNRRLRKYHPEIAEISLGEAANNLSAICREHDFTLFEYFLTDTNGHRLNEEKTTKVLTELDSFLASLINSLDLDKDTLLIISDHGNLEDTSRRTHTENNVPFIVISNDPQRRALLTEGNPGIEDVYHRVLRWFDRNNT